ncbi:MAG: protein kinase [Deltaproteobacteria bacterium]|nr:protein kinase [Deltaproteobacteria bacterium]
MVEPTQKGKRIGRYEVVGEIGRGGMAVVYRARDTALNREVALKLLHPHLAKHKEARQRFQREAHAVARLSHPCVVEIHDYSGEETDEETEDVFIVMELVEGTTLRKFIDSRPDNALPAEAAALIARQVFAALDEAHTENIIHRDVKPENILIGPEGRIKLSDFGIAHLAGVDQMTVTGQILGSPAYMSPEHIEKAELDPRADIFSVGTLLYEMTVGTLPFHGTNPHQIIKRIVEGYYDQPIGANPSIGHQIAQVIVCCMQREPERRYESAGAALSDLDSALESMGIGAPEDELRDFFEDPEAWRERVRPQVIVRTLELGQSARKARRLPEAMDHFNRVLALDPGNRGALDAVSGLSRRRHLRRVLERVGLAAAVLIVAAAVAWPVIKYAGAAIERNTSKQPDEQTQADAGTSDTARGAAVTSPSPRKDAGAEVVDAGAKPKPLPPAKLMVPRVKKTRMVKFRPLPMAMAISIDSGAPFQFKTSDPPRELKTGVHKITFTPTDGAYDDKTWTENIPDGDGVFTIAKKLTLKPARLKIICNTKGMVTVEGRANGTTNSVFRIDLKKKTETFRVLVSAEGYLPEAMQVKMTAGVAVDRNVTLKKEPAAP